MTATRSKKTKSKSTADSSDEAWTCQVCKENFSNPSDKVMECDNCAKHFCANFINMPEAVYEYMATTSGNWCCDKCTVEVKALMKKPVNAGTTDEISKMKVDLDTTMNSVKTLMDDFDYFMNGTKVKSGVTHEPKDNETSTWKTQPTVARPHKEIILETGAEQKKEQDEDLRRRKNVVIFRAPECKATNSKDRYDQDLEIVNQLCGSIDIDSTTVKQRTRLGRKPDDQSEQQTRPLFVTFDMINNADLILMNLTKLKFANENLRQLRVTPDRSVKERENVRFIVQRAKNLTSEESGDYIHIVRGDQLLRENPRSIDGHKREQFNVWFGNVDVLTTEKFLELKTLLQQASALPHNIAITEAKLKNVILKWNPIWFKLDCYKLKDKIWTQKIKEEECYYTYAVTLKPRE